MEISLALGGGGVKGIAHIGVLQSLETAGINVRAISGTSVGAMVGALYASGCSPAEIEGLLNNVDTHQMFRRMPQDHSSLLGFAGLTKTLIDALGDSNFEDLHIPFACTAVDTRTCSEVILHKGLVIESILASSAVPGIFPPREMGDALLIDGGILDPVPVNLARSLAPGLPVVAVALNPPQEAWSDQPAGFQIHINTPIPSPIIDQLSRMRIGQAFSLFVQSVDISGRMLTELHLQVDQPDVVIRPDTSRYGILDQINPEEIIEIGRVACDQAIPEIRKASSWSGRFIRRLRHVKPSTFFERSKS